MQLGSVLNQQIKKATERRSRYLAFHHNFCKTKSTLLPATAEMNWDKGNVQRSSADRGLV